MPTRTKPKRKQKRVPVPAEALGIVARLDVSAAEAAGADGTKKKRTFRIVGYTGGPLDQGSMGWGYPVICDLEGFQLGDGTFPILDNHGPGWSSDKPVREYLVGQSETAKVENGELVLTGTFYEDRPAAADIIKLADDGHKWQASIGAKSAKTEFIGEGLTVNVNGREWDGPVNVVRITALKEVSIVVIGADSNTSALVAGDRGKAMATRVKDSFEEWCKSKDYGDPSGMSAKLKARLRAEYDEENDDETDTEADDDAADDDTGDDENDTEAADDDADSGDDDEEDTEAEDDDEEPRETKARGRGNLRGRGRTGQQNRGPNRLQRREAARISGIQAYTSANPGAMVTVRVNGKNREVPLASHAIKAGWSVKKVKQELIRAGRPDPGPHWYSPSIPILNDAVIEAAVLQAGQCRLGLDSYYSDVKGERRVSEEVQRETQREFNNRYTDQVMQAAHDRFGRYGIGLHQVLTVAAQQRGYRGREKINQGNLEEVLRCAFTGGSIRADGGSTVSIQNLLANVLNKMLLSGYLHTDQSWKEVCSILPVKDFKPAKSINVTGDFLFKKLNADGQIQNAALTDEPFSNQVDTFARKLGLSRQTIINDDLSALTTIPQLMGIGCSDSISQLFWTLFMNPGLWTDGNAFFFARNIVQNALGGGAIQSNLVPAGASSALSQTALQLAITLFDMQVKANGQPLGVPPAILLYPPGLDAVATSLMNSEFVVYGGNAAPASNPTVPDTNVFKGRFKPVKSPYLQNPLYVGNSTTAWYLLAAPQLTGLSLIQMAFLNGQETPTVQTAQANFNELGIDIRGFHDFGVAMQNPRAGVKSPGA